MIIQQLTGGLGNQLFQYAAARALSLRLHTSLSLDTTSFLTTPTGKKNVRSYELFHFNIEEHFAKPRWHWIKKSLKAKNIYPGYVHFFEKHLQVYPEFFELHDRTYLQGCWQSEQYFKTFEKEIRSELSFKTMPDGLNRSLAEKISQVNAVSLHVRRGDYVSNAHFNEVHGTTSLDYYRSAIALIAEKVPAPHFFMFSDEPEWVKEHLQIDFPFDVVAHNKGDKSFEDMRLMSLCQHHIIANSSFSWWGAWLNPSDKKIVIAPQKWFAQSQFNNPDLLPNSWIKL